MIRRLCLFLATLGIVHSVAGKDVTFFWDPPKDADPVWYYVFYEVGFNYTREITKVTVPTVKLGLRPGTYAFAVTMVSIYGEESEPSDLLPYTVPGGKR